MISVIILAHNVREKLAAHLPLLLSQEDVDYEVIVVDMYSEDDTTDLLTNMAEAHACLSHLSLPANAKDISYERLALHLGMRAAISSRILLLDADTKVPSEHWLADVMQEWTPHYDIILIPTVRSRVKHRKDYFTAGHEVWRNRLYLKQAADHGLYRVGNAITGMNKDIFLHSNASARDLALKTGTMDIFVAHTANRGNTMVITDPLLFPCRDACSGSNFWLQQRLFDTETSRHLPQRLLRGITYMWHCLCTIHCGSIPYSLMDLYDKARWCCTGKQTFIKKHY